MLLFWLSCLLIQKKKRSHAAASYRGENCFGIPRHTDYGQFSKDDDQRERNYKDELNNLVTEIYELFIKMYETGKMKFQL